MSFDDVARVIENLARRIRALEVRELASGSGHGIPAGGTDGQVLTKLDATDYNADWETASLAAHPETHEASGADPIRLDDLELPNDNTDLNVSDGAHGLAPKVTVDGYAAVVRSGTLAYEGQYSTINFIIDGGGAAITTGIKGDLVIDFACALSAWTLLADQAGAIKVDIWRDTYANFAPTDADSLTNGHEPEIAASGDKAQDTDLSDWTDATLDAGNVLRFNVDSCTTIQRATLALKVMRL